MNMQEMVNMRIREAKRQQLEQRYNTIFDTYAETRLDMFAKQINGQNKGKRLSSKTKKAIAEELERIERERKDEKNLMALSATEISWEIKSLEFKIAQILPDSGGQTEQNRRKKEIPVHIGPHKYIDSGTMSQLIPSCPVTFDTYPDGKKVVNRGRITSREGSTLEIYCGDDAITNPQAVTSKIKINLDVFSQPIQIKPCYRLDEKPEKGRRIAWKEGDTPYEGEIFRICLHKIKCKNVKSDGRKITGPKYCSIP